MATRTQAYPPPFQVGDRVRYVGNGWRRSSGVPLEDVPMVVSGMVGEVVSNRNGSDAHPWFVDAETGEMYPPIDGWSVVKFPGPGDSNMAAVARGSLDRYERV